MLGYGSRLVTGSKRWKATVRDSIPSASTISIGSAFNGLTPARSMSKSSTIT